MSKKLLKIEMVKLAEKVRDAKDLATAREAVKELMPLAKLEKITKKNWDSNVFGWCEFYLEGVVEQKCLRHQIYRMTRDLRLSQINERGKK